jgi:hypothetical protein
MKEGKYLRNPRHGRGGYVKWVSGKYERIAWTGSMWIRVGTSGGNA